MNGRQPPPGQQRPGMATRGTTNGFNTTMNTTMSSTNTARTTRRNDHGDVFNTTTSARSQNIPTSSRSTMKGMDTTMNTTATFRNTTTTRTATRSTTATTTTAPFSQQPNPLLTTMLLNDKYSDAEQAGIRDYLAHEVERFADARSSLYRFDQCNEDESYDDIEEPAEDALAQQKMKNCPDSLQVPGITCSNLTTPGSCAYCTAHYAALQPPAAKGNLGAKAKDRRQQVVARAGMATQLPQSKGTDLKTLKDPCYGVVYKEYMQMEEKIPLSFAGMMSEKRLAEQQLLENHVVVMKHFLTMYQSGRDELLHLITSIRDIQARTVGITPYIDQLRHQIATIRYQADNLSKKEHNLKQSIATHDNYTTQQAHFNAQVTEQYNIKHVEVGTYQMMYRDKSLKYNHARELHTTLANNSTQLHALLTTLEEESAHTLEATAEAQDLSVVFDLEQKNKILEEKWRTLHSKMTLLVFQVNNSEQQSLKLLSEVEELSAKCAVNKEHCSEMADAKEKYDYHVAQLRSSLNDLKTQTAAMQDALNTTQDEVDVLSQDLTQLRCGQSEQQLRVNTLRTKFEQLTENNHNIKEQNRIVCQDIVTKEDALANNILSHEEQFKQQQGEFEQEMEQFSQEMQDAATTHPKEIADYKMVQELSISNLSAEVQRRAVGKEESEKELNALRVEEEELLEKESKLKGRYEALLQSEELTPDKLDSRIKELEALQEERKRRIRRLLSEEQNYTDVATLTTKRLKVEDSRAHNDNLAKQIVKLGGQNALNLRELAPFRGLGAQRENNTKFHFLSLAQKVDIMTQDPKYNDLLNSAPSSAYSGAGVDQQHGEEENDDEDETNGEHNISAAMTTYQQAHYGDIDPAMSTLRPGSLLPQGQQQQQQQQRRLQQQQQLRSPPRNPTTSRAAASPAIVTTQRMAAGAAPQVVMPASRPGQAPTRAAGAGPRATQITSSITPKAPPMGAPAKAPGLRNPRQSAIDVGNNNNRHNFQDAKRSTITTTQPTATTAATKNRRSDAIPSWERTTKASVNKTAAKK